MSMVEFDSTSPTDCCTMFFISSAMSSLPCGLDNGSNAYSMNQPQNRLVQQRMGMSALSDPPTMAFLCRADLQLSPGKLAVQCAHAAVGSLKQAKKTHSRMVQRWSESASRKVCLAVEDEEELEYYLQQVREASLPFALIKDAGLTEVAPGTVTVLGVGPVQDTQSILFRI